MAAEREEMIAMRSMDAMGKPPGAGRSDEKQRAHTMRWSRCRAVTL